MVLKNLAFPLVQTSPNRYQIVDMVRGLALSAMFIYHMFFFTNLYGFIHIPIHSNLLWISFQKTIAASFFFLVGISLHLAYASGIQFQKFIKRTSILIFCALVVTATSIVLFPKTPVYFGILHSIAACSIMGLLFLNFTRLNILLGCILIWTGLFYSSPMFDTNWLYCLGLGTHRFPAFDFQPLLPWFGVVLLGISTGKFLRETPVIFWQSDALIVRTTAYIGQHTLLLYMGHVPIIFALMELLSH